MDNVYGLGYRYLVQSITMRAAGKVFNEQRAQGYRNVWLGWEDEAVRVGVDLQMVRDVDHMQAKCEDEERSGQLLLAVAGAEVAPHEDVSAAGGADPEPDYWAQVGTQWMEVR